MSTASHSPPLSSPAPQVPGLTLRDRYHIQRAVELVVEGEERSTLAAVLGLADDEHLYEKAFIIALNYIDTLVWMVERLTGCEETGIAGDIPGDLDDHLGDLGAAMAAWATRDDSRAQPEVTRAGHSAVEAIDAMLAELHRARQQLVTEIREHQDAAMARVDALLARHQAGGR
jgi:hypothetical protein